MRKTLRRPLALLAVAVVLLFALSATAMAAGNPTEESGTKMIECSACSTTGLCMTCYGLDATCEACGGTFQCPTCGGTGYVESPSHLVPAASRHRHRPGPDHQGGLLLPVHRHRGRGPALCQLRL